MFSRSLRRPVKLLVCHNVFLYLLWDLELKFGSSLQLQALSPAPCEFQDIEGLVVRPVLGAAVVRFGADRHILFHMDDLFLLVHPYKIERDLRILHPKHPGLGL